MSESTERPARFQFGLSWMFVFTTLCAVAATVIVNDRCAWQFRHTPIALILLVLVMPMLAACSSAICRRQYFRVVLWGVFAFFWIECSMPRMAMVNESERRTNCHNYLKQIGIALHSYHDEYGCFPMAYIADKSGKPMHSWRVLLLPYLDQNELYDAYNLDEPWSGPNNSGLAAEVPNPYWCPSSMTMNPVETSYVLITGPGTMWPDEKAPKIDDATDGPSQTLMVVEVVNSGIHWMEPRDLDISTMEMAINPQKGVGISSDHTAGGANVLFVDGSARFIVEDVTPEQLKALLTRAGGEKIDVDEL